MRTTRLFPVSMMWAKYLNDRRVPIIRDRNLDVIEPFLDFILKAANEKIEAHATPTAYKSTIEYIAYALLALARFLAKFRNFTWLQLTDESLVAFRDWVRDEVRNHNNSGKDESAWNTANYRLRVVYDFLVWAQEDAHLVEGMVGATADYTVHSTLPLYMRTGNQKLKTERLCYPKLKQGIGRNSRRSDRQHWATEDELGGVRQHFWTSKNADGPIRNDLMLRVFDAQGWRRGSVNSLTTDLFSDERLAAAEAAGQSNIEVSPPQQKFDYQRSFRMSLPLAFAIARYIKKERASLLERKGVRDVATHQHRVFLSVKTCTPLTDGAVSRIFSEGFKAAGVVQRAATHAIRRKHGKSAYKEEIEFRAREGLSLAYEDVAMAVADKLGHASITSQDAYLQAIDDYRSNSIEQGLHARIAKLDDMLSQCYLEIARLRSNASKATK